MSNIKSDIEIAQEAKPLHILEIAKAESIDEKYIEQYGSNKAKINYTLLQDVKKNHSKLILVTAITPTPAGEGKTTVSIGLADAFSLLGKKVMLALREPSLGPCFGIKGGAAGGGYAQLVPMVDLNLHFTGDFHAVTSAIHDALPICSVGPGYIKAVRGPLAHIPLMAVGGVNEKNAADFMKAGCVGLGVGGNLVNKEWIKNGEWDKITALAKEFIKAVNEG